MTADKHSPLSQALCQSTATVGIVAPQGAHLSTEIQQYRAKHQMC